MSPLPVTDTGGPWSCEPSGLLHFVDDQLTDISEVFGLTRRPPATLRDIRDVSAIMLYNLRRQFSSQESGELL
jgi:hypothetical protein